MNLLNLHFRKESDKSQHLQVYCVKSPLPSTEDSSVLHHTTTAEHRGQFCITSHHHCQGQMTVLYYITSPLPRVDDSSVLHHITTAKSRWQFPVAWSESWRQEETKERMTGFRTQRTLDNIFWWDRNRQKIEWLAGEHEGHWNVGWHLLMRQEKTTDRMTGFRTQRTLECWIMLDETGTDKR